MQNILLTGGAGYIGSHIAVELINANYFPVVIDNLANSSEKSLERVAKITGVSPKFYKGDCRDEALLTKIFSENEISCVIHLAGLKAVGESVEKPLEYYDNNLNATIALCRAMVAAGVKNFIFSSSATVYNSANPMPLSEESVTGGCTNPYGWTKYMIEQILAGVGRANPDWSVTLLRYFNPVGAHKSGLIGENPRGVPNNLMPFITQVATGKRERLNIFGNDYPTKDGTCVRDYIHVLDLAKGHVKAIEYTLCHKGLETFNLGTGQGYSVLDMVKAFNRANAMEIPFAFAPRRAGDLTECYSTPAKANKILGWKAEETLESMCADSWNWQRQNPNGYED